VKAALDSGLHEFFESEKGSRAMDAGTRELYVVLAVMAAIFIFAIVAVIVFLRQWRKERR
jgi:hypothetical protein